MKTAPAFLFLFLASMAFATEKGSVSKLPELWVSPSKAPLSRLSGLELPSEAVMDARDANVDCSVGCSEVCVSLARRILNDCSAPGPGPGPGPIPGPVDQGCIDTMKTFYGARQGTSSDQDRADAIAYCVSGASAQCATDALTIYIKRSGTSSTDDHTDAGRFCQRRGTFACLSQIFAEYQHRTGTSTTQDVNDAALTCLGGSR